MPFPESSENVGKNHNRVKFHVFSCEKEPWSWYGASSSGCLASLEIPFPKQDERENT